MVVGLLPSFSLPTKAADTEITSTSINITSGNTYTIADAMQLGYFRDIVNGGNNCAGATIKLTSGFSSLCTKSTGKLEVWLNNFCDYFEQDTGRLFSNRECWYCKHGDFGINTELPTKNGVCRYKE